MRKIIEKHLVSGREEKDLQELLLDVFRHIPTRSSAKKALKKSRVLVNGQVYRLSRLPEGGGEVSLLERRPPPARRLRIPLRIAYEDRWLAVIEKPPGLPVSGNRYRTVENALPYNLTLDRNDSFTSPVPVHRLDTPTGGLLLIAKDAPSNVNLGRQFEERTVKKRYRALVSGRLNVHGEINEPVDGREAMTVYRSVRSAPSLKTGFLTLVDLWPVTGRKNQLRLHLSGAGHPVIGDKLYSGESTVLRGKGLFLWAVELSFRHPEKGFPVTVRIPEPAKFKTFLSREERRWSAYNAGKN